MLHGFVDVKIELGDAVEELPLEMARVSYRIAYVGFVQHHRDIVGIHNGLARRKGEVVRNGQTLVSPADIAILQAADSGDAREVDGG